MAKLPGLTRHDDRPSAGGTSKGRVQVRNPIGSVGLQPQARPVDTYSRPQAPNSGPNDFMQLASALSSLSPSLQSFLQNSEQRSKKDAEDRAMRRIGGMSFEEAKAAVDGGKMTEMDNPWFKAAYMKQYGERLAYQRINELTAEYETNFDKDKGSFDQFVRERAQADLEQYGSDPHFTGAYSQIMDQYNAKANQAQAQYRTEQTKLDTIGGVYDTFMGQAQAMQQEGKSPEEIVARLRANYDGNRQLLHVDYREQDKEMVRLAESYAAQGDLEMVRTILSSERTGSDGTKLGPLSANREFQADANRILNAAERQLEENNGKEAFDARMSFSEQARVGKLDQAGLLALHKAKPGVFTDSQVLSIINQNNAFNEQEAELSAKNEQRMALRAQVRASENDLLQRNLDAAQQGRAAYIEEGTVLTDSGETKTVSADDQKKAVAKEIVRQMDWLKENGQLNDDQVFDREVEAFTANNLENPRWKSILAAVPVGAVPFTNSGGELPVQLKEGAEMYLRLHNASPKLLEKHMPDASGRDFFETFRIATQYGGKGLEQALQTATASTADLEANPGAFKQRYDEIDSHVRKIKTPGWFGSSPANQGYVTAEITKLGQFYARQGLGAADALKEARARFEATHTTVNGNFVYTADRDVPPNFGQMVTHGLEKYVADFGAAEGYDASDLTIRPATNGNGWLIVDTLTQLPVDTAERATLTLRSLQEMEDKRQDKLKHDLTIKQKEAIHKYDPWMVIDEDTYLGPFLGSNPSKEEQEMVRQRAKAIMEERKTKKGQGGW